VKIATKKLNKLSVKQKVDLLKNSDGKSSRQLAEAYDVGRTRVQNILKRKHELMEAFEDNDNLSRKRQYVSSVSERPVDAVKDDEADEDDEPEYPVNTAGDVLKRTCHLRHYFMNKGLTKNYDTTVSLESD